MPGLRDVRGQIPGLGRGDPFSGWIDRFLRRGQRICSSIIFDLKKYNPSKKQTDIETLQVTDYYDLTPVNGYEAFYVLGSDVYGPMGRELIPFAKEEAAKEFLKDHKGKSIVKFKEVTPALIKTLD